LNELFDRFANLFVFFPFMKLPHDDVSVFLFDVSPTRLGGAELQDERSKRETTYNGKWLNWTSIFLAVFSIWFRECR
jgi:hypothetical protein